MSGLLVPWTRTVDYVTSVLKYIGCLDGYPRLYVQGVTRVGLPRLGNIDGLAFTGSTPQRKKSQRQPQYPKLQHHCVNVAVDSLTNEQVLPRLCKRIFCASHKLRLVSVCLRGRWTGLQKFGGSTKDPPSFYSRVKETSLP
jgi:hypothetical protein